jgi:hypothetical protein
MKQGDMIKFSGFCLYKDESGQTIWEVSSIDRSGIILEIVDRKIEVYSSGRIYFLNEGNVSSTGDTRIEYI